MAIARRSVAALIAIFSWLALSNHCAFSAISHCGTGFQPVSEHRQDADATACPFHSKPGKSKNSGSQPCCKILRAVVATPAKSLAPAMVDVIRADFAVEKLIVFAPPKISFALATLDTGPPGTTFFAELIGSIRAHAPPL